jgi:menaquinone-9 beta-reductase
MPHKPIIPVDVLIVGSGPAGISTALHLVQQDKQWAERVLVLDKAVHPREKLCGGGVTHLGEIVLKRLGLDMRRAVRQFPVYEARLVYRDVSYAFRGNPVFRVVHRAEFDAWLVAQARARGVRVQEGEGVVAVQPEREYVVVESDTAVYHTQTLVAADGSRSRIRSKLKWNEDGGHVARLIETLTPETVETSWEMREGTAVLEFSPMTRDHLQGYYWDFPSIVDGQPQMNRGVFDSRTHRTAPKANLKQTLRDSMAERERDLEDYELKGHPIRWFDADSPLAQPRVLLVGDAAGADPLVGEGIALGLAYGDVAAQAIVAAFAKGEFSYADYRERVLNHYILWQLPGRVRLARLAYWLQNPMLIRLGWLAARWLIHFTKWGNPNFVPANSPRVRKHGRAVW